MGVFNMRYCVIKDTSTVIDASKTNTNDQFAIAYTSAGFEESEVEILTEEEYLARVESEPKSPQPPTTEERLIMAEETILFLMDINLMGGM